MNEPAGYLAQQLETKSVSDEYHQSQRASRGEGPITQTTIEQQWESQLINDAEFTANRQLPSVTFDVNNSYVAEQLGQRVGEEVSHFYHPTPPPRNPSGFWQRVEQRYKNSFERQALIAEGRAAANSEVMSESFRHAAANQQNYLDLGYSESIVETRVAEWMSPIVAAASPPAVKVAIVAAKAYSMMNRWGFFGHNEVESLETLANRDLNHVRSAQNEFSVTSPNAAEALSVKYRALEAAQNKAVKSETLGDGRIRYYKNEIPSSKPGPTRGAAYVTEYNPKTGDVYTWMESYDQLGNVNRIHSKMYNGQELHAPHYPLTLKDKLEAELYASGLRR